MQSLARAAASLQAACSSTGREVISRAFASGAAAEGGEGVKSTLFRLLRAADRPLTSAELWVQAQEEGLKSKTHMKAMLQQLKLKGALRTRAVAAAAGSKRHGKNSSFGYVLQPAHGGPAVPAPPGA